MAYSETIVLAGGIAHVPILITALKFLDGKTLKLHNSREAVLAQKKASAEKAAAAKLQAQQAAAAAAAAAAKKPPAAPVEKDNSDE